MVLFVFYVTMDNPPFIACGLVKQGKENKNQKDQILTQIDLFFTRVYIFFFIFKNKTDNYCR
jgi:hypothetical protein